MSAQRGALLLELLLAIVVLGIGVAPAAWVLTRAERLTASSRDRERVAAAGRSLLAELPRAACTAPAGGRDDGKLSVHWSATGDSMRGVRAQVSVARRHLVDSLSTYLACP